MSTASSVTKRTFLKGVAASAISLPLSTIRSFAGDMMEASTQLGWLRNGEYAAMMVAEAKGFFADAGVKHTILDGGPGKNSVPIVGAAQAVFGVASSARFVAAARAAKDPIDVAAIGTVFQQFPYAYITIADPGAPDPTPKDLVGKRVGIQSDGDFQLRAFLRANGIDEGAVTTSVVQGGPEPLIAGQIDFMSGYVFNQPYAIEVEAAKSDAAPNVKGKTWKALPYSKYGPPNYADVVFTTGETIKKNPELVRRYLQALAKGIQFAIEQPEETARIAATFPGQVEDAPKLEWRARVQTPLYSSVDSDTHGNLWMNPDTWQRILDFYTSNGELLNPVAVGEVMTNDFTPGKQ